MRRDAIMAIWLFAILASMPARAHHSFSSVFDGKKSITLTGSVTKIEWANPHIHLYIDVKDETGHVINWAIEMGSPNMLIRLGLTRDAMKVGDVVTIEGHLARDGSRLANARTVFMAGKKMFAASSQGSTL
ncbi:MAG: DUF6152 family protein [Vicinamibacterales bacterium]